MNDLYESPSSNLMMSPDLADTDFYVVSERKFLVLFLSTVGMYSAYWFYRNWKTYKTANDLAIWPIPRGIFSIFFVHSLFERIREKATSKQLDLFSNASNVATLYVVLTIVSSIMDRLSSRDYFEPYAGFVSVALVPVICLMLLKVQRVINKCEGDGDGALNANLTGLNYLWVFLGILVWCLVVLGLVVSFGIIDIEG